MASWLSREMLGLLNGLHTAGSKSHILRCDAYCCAASTNPGPQSAQHPLHISYQQVAVALHQYKLQRKHDANGMARRSAAGIHIGGGCAMLACLATLGSFHAPGLPLSAAS